MLQFDSVSVPLLHELVEAGRLPAVVSLMDEGKWQRLETPDHDDAVGVTAGGGRAFAYWHIRPTVLLGDYVTAYKTIVGHIEKPGGRVPACSRTSCGRRTTISGRTS